MQNMTKTIWEILQAKIRWGVGLILGENLSNITINSITIIAVQAATLPLILIELVVYIALSIAVIKRFVSPILDFEKKLLQ